MKPETSSKYERICRQWEELGLQNRPAKEAAELLGVSDVTLRIALRTKRPGEYNPNRFKHRRKKVYIYKKCQYCNADTGIRMDIHVVDENNNKKLGKTSIYLCDSCIGKIFLRLPIDKK